MHYLITSLPLACLENTGPFPAHNLHHQTHLLRYQMVFRVSEYLRRVVAVVIFDDSLLDKASYTLDTVRSEFCVVFDKALKRFEKVIVFIDSAALNELFVFFDYLTHKRLYRLQASLTATCYVMQAFLENLLNSF